MNFKVNGGQIYKKIKNISGTKACIGTTFCHTNNKLFFCKFFYRNVFIY